MRHIRKFNESDYYSIIDPLDYSPQKRELVTKGDIEVVSNLLPKGYSAEIAPGYVSTVQDKERYTQQSIMMIGFMQMIIYQYI